MLICILYFVLFYLSFSTGAFPLVTSTIGNTVLFETPQPRANWWRMFRLRSTLSLKYRLASDLRELGVIMGVTSHDSKCFAGDGKGVKRKSENDLKGGEKRVKVEQMDDVTSTEEERKLNKPPCSSIEANDSSVNEANKSSTDAKAEKSSSSSNTNDETASSSANETNTSSAENQKNCSSSTANEESKFLKRESSASSSVTKESNAVETLLLSDSQKEPHKLDDEIKQELIKVETMRTTGDVEPLKKETLEMSATCDAATPVDVSHVTSENEVDMVFERIECPDDLTWDVEAGCLVPTSSPSEPGPA